MILSIAIIMLVLTVCCIAAELAELTSNDEPMELTGEPDSPPAP